MLCRATKRVISIRGRSIIRPIKDSALHMKKAEFEDRLERLHELGNELSLAKSVEGLCRSAVRLGRKRLGFDRLSTWFVDQADKDFIIGSFGVDEKGRVRQETGERVAIDEDPAMRQIRLNRARSVLRHGVPLRDDSGAVVGRGSHIIAAIWNGKEVIGYICTDNLLRKRPLAGEDREIAEFFASTFGHLYSLKKAEESLRAAYNKLEGVQEQLIQSAKAEVVGTLASGVAHEVKNPLAIMLQGIDYLSRNTEKRNEKAAMTLKRMRGAVKKANGIINGLLDFSVFAELKLTTRDLSSVIKSSLVLVKHEIDRNRIKITEDFGGELPPVRIDRGRIEQVLVNVFLNAIDQMPKGGILTIRTYAVHPPKNRGTVVAEIKDTGPGIAKNILDRVFDPFFTTRRSSGGTGLGLTIAKNIMDRHGGSIKIENVTRRGAKVTLKFKSTIEGRR